MIYLNVGTAGSQDCERSFWTTVCWLVLFDDHHGMEIYAEQCILMGDVMCEGLARGSCISGHEKTSKQLIQSRDQSYVTT